MSTEIWSDLHHGIIKDARGSVKKVVNADAVATSIHNILRTRPGERVMLPTFASAIGSAVFEPMNEDLINLLGTRIREVIERWDDRVSVQVVDFYQDPEAQYVQATITYQIRGSDNTFQTTVNLGG